MGARNTPEQARKYSSEYRAKQRALGLCERIIWCRPEDAEEIRSYARKLAARKPSPSPR